MVLGSFVASQANVAKMRVFYGSNLDSAAVSIFVVILVELTNTVFVNSTNIKTNIETAVLSKAVWLSFDIDLCVRLTRRVEMVSGSITRLRKSDPLISSTRQSRT